MITAIVISFVIGLALTAQWIKNNNQRTAAKRAVIVADANKVHAAYFAGKIDRENYSIALRNLKISYDSASLNL